MAKFMILYSSSTPASELMANSSPEQIKASMDEWIKWQEEASKTARVEFGLPLQLVGKVTPNGVTEASSNISGYATVEGESKDAILKLLETHPHLKRADASIEVFEMLSMPGLKTD